jgi:uncharacterized repeat protein (TIGR01451 family)
MSTCKTSRSFDVIRVARMALGVLMVLGLLGPTAVLAHPPGITEWVDASSDGSAANNQSDFPDISADGRFVAFASLASNLVPDDTNDVADVFVRDRLTGAIERVSVDSRGRQGNGDSGLVGVGSPRPAISADGRFVAFPSFATNLVRKDKNDSLISDIFVHDRLTGTTELVSLSSTGEQTDAYSTSPAISADGRYIAFQSNATTLVPDDTNFVDDIFVHDRLTGTTERVSVSSTGEQANGSSILPDISPDGRFVVFSSFADNLVPGSQVFIQVFLHDRDTGITERISQDTFGNAGDGSSVFPSVSADGRFVAFESNAANLVADGNHESHIYLRDRQTGVTERVSENSAGEPADLLSGKPDITADGRFVTFFSLATNLFVGDTNNRRDIFVRDLQTGSVVRASVSTAGEQGNSESIDPKVSNDGLVVAFKSNSNNLVPGANGGIFVHDDRPAADLSVVKSDSPDPVARRAELTYSIVATNHGPGSAVNVQLTDTLPEDAKLVSVTATTGSCAANESIVTCSLGDLSNGSSVTVTLIVTVKKAGTITNTAQVNSISPDPDPANNIDTEETMIVR